MSYGNGYNFNNMSNTGYIPNMVGSQFGNSYNPYGQYNMGNYGMQPSVPPNMMQNQQPVQQQQMQNNQQQNITFECTPVYSEKEAIDAAIDLGGKPRYFVEIDKETNLATKVYEKRLNMKTGGFLFDSFQRVEKENVVAPTVLPNLDLSTVASKEDLDNLVKKEDIQAFGNNIMSLLNEQENRIMNSFKDLIGGNNNDTTNANANANKGKPSNGANIATTTTK